MNITNMLKALFQRPPPRPKNTGVLLGNEPTDYFAGVNSPIEYKVRLQDGNWTPYSFDEEVQWCLNNGQYVDQMSCVSHSVINAVQSQELFLTGKRVQYSKRWLAKMSDTTRNGNYLGKVAQTIRDFGLVLESDYPTPASYTWEEFYADIPEPKLTELKEKGQAWLKRWNFQYEFLAVTDPNLDYHLKHSPVQVVIPGHAICGIYSPDQMMTVMDSYAPHVKKYQVVGLQAAMKPILTQKTIQAREIQWYQSPELGLYLPFDSMQRRDHIRAKLSEWLPDYNVDTTKTYQLTAKKPTWG